MAATLAAGMAEDTTKISGMLSVGSIPETGHSVSSALQMVCRRGDTAISFSRRWSVGAMNSGNGGAVEMIHGVTNLGNSEQSDQRQQNRRRHESPAHCCSLPIPRSFVSAECTDGLRPRLPSCVEVQYVSVHNRLHRLNSFSIIIFIKKEIELSSGIHIGRKRSN